MYYVRDPPLNQLSELHEQRRGFTWLRLVVYQTSRKSDFLFEIWFWQRAGKRAQPSLIVEPGQSRFSRRNSRAVPSPLYVTKVFDAERCTVRLNSLIIWNCVCNNEKDNVGVCWWNDDCCIYIYTCLHCYTCIDPQTGLYIHKCLYRSLNLFVHTYILASIVKLDQYNYGNWI